MAALHANNPLVFFSRLEELVQLVHTHGQPVQEEEPDLEIPPPQVLFAAAGLAPSTETCEATSAIECASA